MSKIIVLIFLIYESMEDLKNKSISINSVMVFAVAGVLMNICSKADFKEIAFSLGAGVFLLALCIVSKGALGAGDAMIFGVLSLYIGKQTFMVLMDSFILAMVIAFIVQFINHKNHKSSKNNVKRIKELPFIPCVMAAYMEVMFREI